MRLRGDGTHVEFQHQEVDAEGTQVSDLLHNEAIFLKGAREAVLDPGAVQA